MHKFFKMNDKKIHRLDKELSSEYVIWDLDGTLYDLDKLVKRIKSELMRRPFLFKEIVNFYSVERRITKERRSQCFNLKRYERRFAQMQKFINSFLTSDLVFQETIFLIENLHKKGIKQLLISEYPIANKLDLLGLNKLKSVFINTHSSPEDLFFWKPDIRMAKKLGELYDFKKGLIVIGDRSDTDGLLFQNISNL